MHADPNIPNSSATRTRDSRPQPALLLTSALIPLAAVAAGAGLLFPEVYRRNPATIIPAMRGQDLVTLLALVVLGVALLGAWRQSARATVIWLGLLGYLGYTYVGAALGYYFAELTPLYILLFSLAVFAIGSALATLDIERIAEQFDRQTPRRSAASFLVLIGLLLAVLELGQYGAFLASGELPAGVVAAGGGSYFVYGLDLGLVLPLSILGAAWLWQRRPWGHVLAGALMIKATTMGAALLAMNWFSLQAGQPTDPLELLGFYGLLALGGLVMALWFFSHCAPKP